MTSIFGSISQMAGVGEAIAKLKAGDARGAYDGLRAANPVFRDFSDRNAGKPAAQIARDNGIDLASILK